VFRELSEAEFPKHREAQGRSVGMPILGVGTDIVETERIRELYERETDFADRVFTQRELDYSLSKETRFLHLAARFAAKEAVAKALGRSFGWKDVELVNNSDGKPEITLYGRAKEVAGDAMIHVSVSHTRNYASAVAVVEK
jgi:holo-[acyl-carrier protein] synthase